MMDLNKTKNIIEDLVKRMGIPLESVDLLNDEAGSIVCFHIKSPEPELLIGKDGATLLALNHLVHRILDQDEGAFSDRKFIIDVNNYQKKKIEDLKQKAKMMAERARFFKSSVELEPMSAYERMVIHSALESFPNVFTESLGSGAGRRVVIRYKEEII